MNIYGIPAFCFLMFALAAGDGGNKPHTYVLVCKKKTKDAHIFTFMCGRVRERKRFGTDIKPSVQDRVVPREGQLELTPFECQSIQ